MSDAKIRRCLIVALAALCWGILSGVQQVNADVDRYSCQYTNCTYRALDSEQAKSPPYTVDYHRACNRPQSREEADLCQQWRMAEATDMAAEIAANQLRATFTEIVFLIFTVTLTGWAAYAASKAAGAADRSISITRELGEKQIRAYVGVIEAKVTNFNVGETIRIHVTIRNSGQSLALEVGQCITIETIASSQDPDFDFTELEKKQPQADLVVGGKIGTGRKWVKPCSQELIDYIMTGWGKLLIAGRIKYKDVFGVERETAYRMRLLPDSMEKGEGVFVPETTGNYST